MERRNRTGGWWRIGWGGGGVIWRREGGDGRGRGDGGGWRWGGGD